MFPTARRRRVSSSPRASWRGSLAFAPVSCVRACAAPAARLPSLGSATFLHLPYFSLWKTLGATSAGERALLFACDALQVIAATQLFVLFLQWIAGRQWTRWAGVIAVAVIAATPLVLVLGGRRAPPGSPRSLARREYGLALSRLSVRGVVLAGTLAGATSRPGRAASAPPPRGGLGLGLVVLGVALSRGALGPGGLLGRFTGLTPSCGSAGCCSCCAWSRPATSARVPGTRALALLGHETLLVYVLHLTLLFGGVFGDSPLTRWHARMGLPGAFGVLLLLLPATARRGVACGATAKHRAPHEAQLALVFVTVAFLYEFAVRPW